MAEIANSIVPDILAIIHSVDQMSIPVGKTHVALIDECDADALTGYNWMFNGRYAYTLVDGKALFMHRLVASPPDEMLVDHIDGDGLNNQRHNLRICTHTQNMWNRRSSCGASRFKGVHLDKGAWRAQINVKGKRISLGTFTTETKAARAYDKAAVEFFGEFACTNRELGLL